jgi:hypothetical protein
MTSRSNLNKTAIGVGAFSLLVLSLLCSVPARGQVAGATLLGTVKDPSGAVVPNAQVSVKNIGTGVLRETSSDAAGLYSVPDLLPGSYAVTISAPGFSVEVESGITLDVGETHELNISLQVGAVTSKVEVTSSAPGVQLATSSLGAEVNSTTLRELPLNGRDWTQLAVLEPGVVAIRTQAAANSTANRGNRGFGDELTDSGHSPYQNNYRVNGISVNDYTNGSPGSVLGVQLGVDAIQEFSVLTSNYSAEYGRASGAIINAITRSGTNQLHGTAYWFLRDKDFDARNFFDPPKIPPFHRNQFGASAGAPIFKNRTFIFVAFEAVRQDLSQSLVDTVPTAAARAGNLCSVPETGCTPNSVTVNPNVVPYLGFWPMPNGGLVPNGNGDTGYYTTSGLQNLSENYVTARGDHKISDKDSLDASWFYDKSHLNLPDALLISNTQSVTDRQMGSVEWTHVFGPTVVNNVRVGYSRSQGLIADPLNAINPLASDTSLGAVPGLNAPILSVPGLTLMQGALGAITNIHHTQNSYQFYDDAFLTKGTHNIKFGFSVEDIRYNELDDQLGNGEFVFPSLSGFLTNQPSSLTILDPAFLHEAAFREAVFGLYVQDDWHVRRNLTLNLGLRYEPTTLPAEAHNLFGVMENFSSGGLTSPVPSLWQTNATLHNFEPRIGFAWDPFNTDKTSIRGGFGMYSVLPLPWTLAQTVGPNYPFGFSAVNGNLPAGSFPTEAVTLTPFIPSNSVGVYFIQHPGRSYTENWNLNVQRELAQSLTLTIGYVGSHSINLPWKMQDQDMVLPTLTSAGYLWPCNPSFNPCTGHGTKLNTSVGGIAATLFDASGSYNALQVGVLKKMSDGFQVQGSYTWGKCFDTNSNSIATDTYLNSARDLPYFTDTRALCDYNITQNFVGNFLWDAPKPGFGGAAGERILGGWELGGVITASTGSPFTALISGNPLGMNSSDAQDYPDRVPGPNCQNPTNPGSIAYLNLNCFTPPTAPASFAAMCQPAAASVAAVIPNTCMNLLGDNGRNTIIGPGLFDFDFSIVKNNYIPRISESFNIQFRLELFNVLNHANFQAPLDNKTIFTQTGTLVGGAGDIDATSTTSRQVQLGLKVIW